MHPPNHRPSVVRCKFELSIIIAPSPANNCWQPTRACRQLEKRDSSFHTDCVVALLIYRIVTVENSGAQNWLTQEPNHKAGEESGTGSQVGTKFMIRVASILPSFRIFSLFVPPIRHSHLAYCTWDPLSMALAHSSVRSATRHEMSHGIYTALFLQALSCCVIY